MPSGWCTAVFSSMTPARLGGVIDRPAERHDAAPVVTEGHDGAVERRARRCTPRGRRPAARAGGARPCARRSPCRAGRPRRRARRASRPRPRARTPRPGGARGRTTSDCRARRGSCPRPGRRDARARRRCRGGASRGVMPLIRAASGDRQDAAEARVEAGQSGWRKRGTPASPGEFHHGRVEARARRPSAARGRPGGASPALRRA